MPRKKSHIHYIYKTTCLVTNRYYYGMHSTSNLDDGYIGSGKRLRYSIRKYGEENHKKEILEFFDNRELLIEGEINFISNDMVNDPNCMNLRKGGTGGFTVEQQKENARKSNEKQKLLANDKEWVTKKRKNQSEGMKKAYDEGKKKRGVFYDWTGKSQSMESNQLRSNKMKNRFMGEENFHYGSRWITNGNNNKKIKKYDQIPDGWRLGRIMKISPLKAIS